MHSSPSKGCASQCVLFTVGGELGESCIPKCCYEMISFFWTPQTRCYGNLTGFTGMHCLPFAEVIFFLGSNSTRRLRLGIVSLCECGKYLWIRFDSVDFNRLCRMFVEVCVCHVCVLVFHSSLAPYVLSLPLFVFRCLIFKYSVPVLSSAAAKASADYILGERTPWKNISSQTNFPTTNSDSLSLRSSL